MSNGFDILLELFEDMEPRLRDEMYLSRLLDENDRERTISCLRLEHVLKKLKQASFCATNGDCPSTIDLERVAGFAGTLLKDNKWEKNQTATLFLLGSTLELDDSARPAELTQLWEKYASYCEEECSQLSRWDNSNHINYVFFTLLLQKRILRNEDVATPKLEYQKSLGFIDPHLLEFSIPCNAADFGDATEFSRILRNCADSSHEVLEESIKEFNQNVLAKQLRIIQWEILIRDIEEESRGGSKDICYVIGTDQRNKPLPGVVSESFHNGLNRIEHALTQIDAGIGNVTLDHLSKVYKYYIDDQNTISISDRLRMFYYMLPEVKKYNAYAFRDIVETFANVVDPILIIEDAELTFFSLLWLFRHGASKCDISAWLKLGPDHDISKEQWPLDFQYKDRRSYWASIDPVGFFKLVGLFLPSVFRHNRLVPTRRMKRFYLWMEKWLNNPLLTQRSEIRTNTELQFPNGYQFDDLIGVFPVKKFRYGSEEREFLQNLLLSLAGEKATDLRHLLSECAFPAGGDMPYELISKTFVKFLQVFDSIIYSKVAMKPTESELDGLNDTVINRLCRSPYLPAEFLFRSNQPYDIDLLVLAFEFTEANWIGKNNLAPMILAFASVVGGVGQQHSCLSSKNKENAKLGDLPNSNARISSPYWLTLSEMSSEITTELLRTKARKVGERSGMALVLHQLPKDIKAFESTLLGKIAHLENLRGRNELINPAEIPSISMPDALGVMIMSIEAANRKRLYELPEACANILADTWNAKNLKELIRRVVIEQARHRVLADETIQSLRPKLTSVDVEKLFIDPEIIIDKPFRLTNPRGIYPLVLAILRNAYQHTMIGFLHPDCSIEPKITIIRSIDSAREIELITFMNTGMSPVAIVKDMKQDGLNTDFDIYDKLTGRWSVKKKLEQYSWYDDTLKQWISQIEGKPEF